MACTNKEALEFHAGGNDWEALLKAKARMKLVVANPDLPWFEREMAMELLKAGSLVEYEQCRANYAEVAEALSPK